MKTQAYCAVYEADGERHLDPLKTGDTHQMVMSMVARLGPVRPGMFREWVFMGDYVDVVPVDITLTERGE